MKRLMISLLGALAFAAAAQAAEPQVVESQATEPQAAQSQETASSATTMPGTQDATQAPEVNDRYCLRHTGTRIRHAADTRRSAKCNQMANGRAYTREDMDLTGEIDIAAALRKLDPSIH
jgi:hypothetical protein